LSINCSNSRTSEKHRLGCIGPPVVVGARVKSVVTRQDWEMARHANLGNGERARSGSSQDGINTLAIILDFGVSVESIPLPSEDHVSSTGQVGRNGDTVVCYFVTFVLCPDLEPLHFTFGLVSVIGKVNEAITRVNGIELECDTLRLSSSEI